MAGFFAGVTEGILVNPFEVIKVQLQSNRKKVKESPSTYAVTRKIIKHHGFGLNGLNKGLTATILRNAVFNSFYFGFYYSVKGYIPVNEDSWLDFLTKVKFQINLILVRSKKYFMFPGLKIDSSIFF